MQMLYETCVPPPNGDPILSTTSCLMLGNFITSDATANELLSRVPYKKIFAMLGISTNSAWTNAAAGLLRQLAQPAQSRKQLAADPEALRASIGVYLNSAIADVQAAGLRLTRTLLRDQVDAVISFVTPDSERCVALQALQKNPTLLKLRLSQTWPTKPLGLLLHHLDNHTRRPRRSSHAHDFHPTNPHKTLSIQPQPRRPHHLHLDSRNRRALRFRRPVLGNATDPVRVMASVEPARKTPRRRGASDGTLPGRETGGEVGGAD